MTTDLSKLSFVPTNGIDLATYQQGVGPPVILLHGFPELAHSWRHQMKALAENGWCAIAPDLRGYGWTGPKGDVAAYSMRNLCHDVLGLLDALRIDQAVLVGHDFGGALAWSLARDHSRRVAGVISLNTPYTRRGSRDLLATMRMRRGEANYMVAFQVPGVGEAMLERDVSASFSGLMRRPAIPLDEFERVGAHLKALPMTLFIGEPLVMGEPIMDEKDLAVYIEAFERTGFAGALNWYRNLQANWLDSAASEDRITVPALMVSASHDFFLPPWTTHGMETHVQDLERDLIVGCGHWTQQECPLETNRIILDWLNRRMRPIF